MHGAGTQWTTAEATKWANDLYNNHVDKKDAVGFAAVFTDDGTLRFGNNDVLRGPQAIEAAIAGFFQAMVSLKHKTTKLTLHENMIFLEAMVTYKRHDGNSVSVFAMTVYGLVDAADGKRARECRIYVDLAPCSLPDVSIEVRVLGAHEASVLECMAADVFDNELVVRSCMEFFECPRHHLVVALDGQTVIGMASGVHYVHPDKPPELWVNELGVSERYRHQGVGRRMLDALFAHAHTLGCKDAWVLTEESNRIARRLYDRAGGEDIGVVMYSFRLTPEPASSVG